MEPASPARLYATVVGAILVVLGILGFFYTASFGDLDSYEEALGELEVNGWLNLFYIAVGALGLLAASAAARPYALATGVLFTLLAIVGWGSGALNLVVGLLGLAAAAGTSKPSQRPMKRGSKVAKKATKEPRKSKPRTQSTRKRA